MVWGQERPDQPLVFPLNKKTPPLPAPTPTGSWSRPNFDWQMKQVVSGSDATGLDTGVDHGRLVYEDIYKYPFQGSGAPPGQGSPSQKPGGHDKVSQVYRPDIGLPPQQVEEVGRPFRTISSRQSGYKPHKESFPLQQKVDYQLFLQRPQDGVARPPPPPPPKRIIQSSNSFQRYSQIYRMSKYDPIDARKPEGVSGVGPAVKPAGSQNFMRPPWYGHPR